MSKSETLIKIIKFLLGILMLSFIISPEILLSDEREGSGETFLCRGQGAWISPRDRMGNVIIFIFKSNDTYCAVETSDSLNKSCGLYEVYSRENENGEKQYYLRLTDRTGRILKMSLEVMDEYTIVINGRQLRRKE